MNSIVFSLGENSLIYFEEFIILLHNIINSNEISSIISSINIIGTYFLVSKDNLLNYSLNEISILFNLLLNEKFTIDQKLEILLNLSEILDIIHSPVEFSNELINLFHHFTNSLQDIQQNESKEIIFKYSSILLNCYKSFLQMFQFDENEINLLKLKNNNSILYLNYSKIFNLFKLISNFNYFNEDIFFSFLKLIDLMIDIYQEIICVKLHTKDITNILDKCKNSNNLRIIQELEKIKNKISKC